MFYSHIWDAEHDAAIKISKWRRWSDLWRNWRRHDALWRTLSILHVYTCDTCFIVISGTLNTMLCYQNFEMTSLARLMTQLTSTWRTMTHFVNFTFIHVLHMFYSHIWVAENDAAIKISIWRHWRDLWRNWRRHDALWLKHFASLCDIDRFVTS